MQSQAIAGPSHIPIDPALIPLPPPGINELERERTGTPLPVTKKGGSRHAVKADPKGKGKGRASFNADKKRKRDDDEKGKKGRTKGAANYRDDEVQLLLDLAEAELPVGAKGWRNVGINHRQWCRENGRPERTDKSLKTKFKQVRSFYDIHLMQSNIHDL
jgi:hypothetical protein